MSEHFDVLIVGAGLSGIGAARHLMAQCPDKRFAILEGRESIGGTWDLFRYPGVRSDSDMYTLGYDFKPWTQARAIADGASIRDYIQEAADEAGLNGKIHLGHKVVRAQWSSVTARWSVQVRLTATGELRTLSCHFLMMCSGYYDYHCAYTPDFKGREDFQGDIVHPQFWPEGLDYTGKRVLVIGSGATAVTLVPSLAERAQHVTMLQRSPTYVMAVPHADPMADGLRKFVPESWVYRFVRRRNVFLSGFIYRLCRRHPALMRRFILSQVRKQLGPDADLSHFSPSYGPWEQRLCVAPDGDLFAALRSRKASVVTDHIDTFTPQGVRLKSGRELTADLIVTATGLNLQLFGGMAVEVDGRPVRMTEQFNYKGMMFNDLPNFSYTVGYTNASWTLKADLIAKYVCRLLQHMDRTGTEICVPRVKGQVPREAPFMDMTSGYFQRAAGTVLPKGASQAPWMLHNDYGKDREQLLRGPVTDDVMVFTVADTQIAHQRAPQPARPHAA